MYTSQLTIVCLQKLIIEFHSVRADDKMCVSENQPSSKFATFRPQSNKLKTLPKCFWEFPKIFTYYALHASYYACIMFQYEQH